MDLLACAGLFAAIKDQQTPTIKPLTLSLSAKGSADVEKGNKLFLAGNFKDASAAYDDASLANDSSPIPWVNGGLSAKELGKLGLAKLAMNTAFHMGDHSVKGKVISAGIDLARKQFEPSKSKYEESLFIDPKEPFGLLGYAQWNLKQAHLRESERFMWQGYREGALVVMDSKLHSENNYNATGGTGDGSVSLTGQMLGSDAATAYQAGLLTQTVGGSALQQLAKLDFAMNTPLGVIAGNHRDLQSDRPGTSIPSIYLPSSPRSRLDLRHDDYSQHVFLCSGA
jgi:tetratricopeptide (TPR) repeat protein